MNFAGAGAWFKRNGVICALLAAIAAALALGPRGGPPEEPESQTEDTRPTAVPSRPAPDQDELRRALDAASARQSRGRNAAPSEEDPAMAEHLEKLGENLEPDESAARLSALGNLYQQKNQDFRTAASYYELLIEKHPDWEGIGGAYRQLIACYTQLGDEPELRLLYRKMIEAFAEGTPEHEFAREALSR